MLSFLSYIAIKAFGTKRGITFAGFLAGFISSTALAFSFSAQSRKNPNIVMPYVLAIIIASTGMFFRVILEVAILNRELVADLLLPILSMGFVGILAAVFYWVKKQPASKKVKDQVSEMQSPFQIKPALKFSFFFLLVLFLSQAANDLVGERGIYITSILSGLLDVDAITVSMASLAKTDISHRVATIAITLAAMTNTLAKAAIFLLFGSRQAANKILTVFLLMVFAGGVSILFL